MAVANPARRTPAATEGQPRAVLVALAMQSWVVALVSLMGYIHASFYLPSASWIYPMCALMLILAIWHLWSWRFVNGSMFDPYAFFLIAALIFNGGHPILEVFGLNRNGILYDRFDSDLLLQTIYLVNLCLAGFHFGALLSFWFVEHYHQTRPNTSPSLDARAVRIVGWILLAISIGPAISNYLSQIQIVSNSGYFALYQQESSTGVRASGRILANFLIPAIFFLLVGSNGRPLERYASLALIMGNAAVLFYLGMRSDAVMPLLFYGWLWHRSVRRIPAGLMMAVALLMIGVVFPLIGQTRNSNIEDRFSINYMVDTLVSLENPLVASLTEMGGSMQTVAYTIMLVPSERPFDQGASYFFSLLTLFPNLFWDIHPTIARGLPSDWLTWQINPWLARQGGGLGFSFVAEAFFNFGWYGSALAMIVTGFLFGWLILWSSRSNDPARMAMVAVLFSFALFWVRQESTMVIRPLVWYALGPYLLIFVVQQVLRFRDQRHRLLRKA